MSNALYSFYSDFLNANSWEQRKDGVSLELLDNLSFEEKEIAEKELIKKASFEDSWAIIGLGYLGSTLVLDTLYDLITKSSTKSKIVIANSIFKINKDSKMIEIVINEVKNLKDTYDIINILYMLPDFKNPQTTQLLKDFCNHEDYLVSNNAKNVLNLHNKK